MGEASQSTAGGMAIHPVTVAVEQDRPAHPVGDGVIDRPTHRRRERDQRQLGVRAEHAKYAVTVLLAQVVDGGVAGLEHAQSEQAEHGDHGEVERVGRRAGGHDHRLELQMGQAKRG
jgi:hypothetical protein